MTIPMQLQADDRELAMDVRDVVQAAGGGDYNTLEAAFANLVDDMTILVRPGTYQLTATLKSEKKNLTVRSARAAASRKRRLARSSIFFLVMPSGWLAVKARISFWYSPSAS